MPNLVLLDALWWMQLRLMCSGVLDVAIHTLKGASHRPPGISFKQPNTPIRLESIANTPERYIIKVQWPVLRGSLRRSGKVG